MKEINIQDIHDGKRIPTLEVIGKQHTELYEENIPTVICPCGLELPLDKVFRCLYCEIYFCKSCAEDHFK